MNFNIPENCIIGICDAAPLEEERKRLISTPTPFVTQDVEKRINPAKSLATAKSVIVLGKAYNPSPTSNLSSLAYGTDYHITIRKLLKKIATQLKCNAHIMVDSGPLAERAFAVKAGLGFWGKNGMVISPKLGSYFNIGLLIVDIVLPYSQAINEKCPDNCRLCLDACPNNAIGKPMDCASYHTQKKSTLSLKEMAGQLYGCDVCQVCCPFNPKAIKLSTIDSQTIIDMSEDDFTCKFGHTAMSWRGLAHLKRNAKLFLKTQK